jgi:hypothetical protein
VENPFIYGKEVTGKSFCNRKKEISELKRDVENSQNVIIFSQRRFGKTSLIKEVLSRINRKGILTIYADLYSVLSEEDFARIYAEAVTSSIFGKIQKQFKNITMFFKKIRPKLSFAEDGQPSFSVDIEKAELMPSIKDVIESVKRYANSKNKKVAVVFDEFQQIGQLKTDHLTKVIRSLTQSHNKISYIYMGSKKHLIMDMFNNPNNPFYRSAKPFPLEKISEKELIEFIKVKFRSTKKKISQDLTKQIVEICEAHPYYVQYLCHIIWEEVIERKTVNKGDLAKSLDLLLKRESSTYEATMDLLTTRQKQALIALAKAAPDEKVFSSEFLNRFNLGAASSFQRTVRSLLEKDLIDKDNGKYCIIDVFFKEWLANL